MTAPGMQRLGDMLHEWWVSEGYRRGARQVRRHGALQSMLTARRLDRMTTNNDYRIVQLTAQLITWEAETPDDEYTPQDKAKIFVQGVLDEGFTTPAQADDEPSRWVWEIVELLGYGPGFDPFEAHEYISRLIDECDFFND